VHFWDSHVKKEHDCKAMYDEWLNTIEKGERWLGAQPYLVGLSLHRHGKMSCKVYKFTNKAFSQEVRLLGSLLITRN